MFGKILFVNDKFDHQKSTAFKCGCASLHSAVWFIVKLIHDNIVRGFFPLSIAGFLLLTNTMNATVVKLRLFAVRRKEPNQ